jgi:hypothetical protein
LSVKYAVQQPLLVASVALAVFVVATGLRAQVPVTINPQARLVPATELRLSGEVDSNSPAVWDLFRGIPFLYVATSFGGQPSTARGRSLTTLGTAQPVTLDPWPGGGVWIEAIVPDVDGTWYGYYHNEMPATPVCPSSNKVIPRIGAARSDDRGRTWEDLGIVLEAPASTFACATNNVFFVNGIGDFSVQLDADSRDLYFFFSQYERASVQQGVAVARLAWADRDEPEGKVMVWRTRFWIPAAREVADGDETTWAFGAGVPIFPVSDGWHDEGTTTNAFWGPSVHWNTYLQMYVMLLNRAKDTKYNEEGIYVSFTSRLNDPRLWSAPMKILNGGSWYPQVIGLDEGTGTDKIAGEWARFFMAGTSRHLVHFTRQ